MYTNFIRLRTLRSRSCNRVPSRFASSSSIATKQPSPGLGGLLGWLTGDRSSLVPPLDFPLSNINLPPTLLDYVNLPLKLRRLLVPLLVYMLTVVQSMRLR